jgi:hypothetical protein
LEGIADTHPNVLAFVLIPNLGQGYDPGVSANNSVPHHALNELYTLCVPLYNFRGELIWYWFNIGELHMMG